MQLKSARTRSSKFGQVLVLETHPEAGPKYLLGFQVAPKERLAEVVATIDVLLQMHITSPNSGVHAAHISDVKGMSREALDVLSQECVRGAEAVWVGRSRAGWTRTGAGGDLSNGSRSRHACAGTT